MRTCRLPALVTVTGKLESVQSKLQDKCSLLNQLALILHSAQEAEMLHEHAFGFKCDKSLVCPQNPAILDASTDREVIRSTLERLQGKMDELQKRAFAFKNHQKNLKVGLLQSLIFCFSFCLIYLTQSLIAKIYIAPLQCCSS